MENHTQHMLVMAMYRLLARLSENGVLTSAEAAEVMTGAADDTRTGTEDGSSANSGENAARVAEQIAEWLLSAETKP